MRKMNVESALADWTMDYLTCRPQYVRMKNCVSSKLLSSTGAPQGTVLSPSLFSVYTSDFQYNTGACFLQKFSDDSTVVGCVNGGCEEEYRGTISDFVDINHLQLNNSKTKEMVIDYRRRRPAPAPVTIKGADVEVVSIWECSCMITWTGLATWTLGGRVQEKSELPVFFEKAEVF